MIDVYVMDTNSISEGQLYEKMLQLLPSDRKAKIRSMKHEQVKKLSAAAGFLLLYGMSQRGVSISAVQNNETIIGEHGKPVFSKELANVHFNLSHSGTKVACIISDSECGVDIEKVNEKRVKEHLIEKVCTKEECALLSAMDENTRNTLFFKLWTVKESVMKKSGKGFVMNPLTIETSEMLMKSNMKLGEDYIYSFPQNGDEESYYLSVCCAEEYKKEPHHVDNAALLEFINQTELYFSISQSDP